MAALLLSLGALIVSLASVGLCWFLADRTAAARASAPGEIMLRMAELEQEWTDTLDSNTRFLKRVSERDRREAKKAAQDAPEPTNGAPVGTKAHLRQLARERGLM